MAFPSDITPELCRQLLRYEPETGRLFWRSRALEMFPDERAWKIWNTRYAGSEAFTATSNGYRIGRIFDRAYKAHRVGWAMHHGAWPQAGYDVDHINGIPGDNRIENLRAVPHKVNNRNNRRPSNNTSGSAGVSWSKAAQKWEAYIGNGQERVYLGIFEDREAAVQARADAQATLGYHANHGRA